MTSVLRALRLLRFREWFYFLVLPLAGFDPSAGAAHAALPPARGVAVAFCVLAFGYLLNAASDVGVDADPRKNPLLDAARRPPVRAVVAVLAVVALGMAATGPRVALLAAATSLASGLVYSVGPRLKAVPVAGTLANATNFVPLLWVGASVDAAPLAVHLAPAFAGILLQSQLLHEAADAADDRRGGVRTTFSWLGRGGSAALAALFGAAPAAGSTALGPGARLALAAVYVVAFPLALAVFARDPRRAATLRALHRVSGLALGAALFLRDA